MHSFKIHFLFSNLVGKSLIANEQTYRCSIDHFLLFFKLYLIGIYTNLLYLQIKLLTN